MKFPITILAVLTAGLFLGACGSTDKPDKEKKQLVTLVPEKKNIEIREFTRDIKNTNADRLRFSHAALTVLGLRIPEGMVPAKYAPAKVYRFEGSYTRSYPVAQAIEIVEEQIDTKNKKMEGKGCLFREALVKSSSDLSRRLAIRVFDSNGRGASIDVWLEADYGKLNGNGSGSQGSHNTGSAGAVSTAKPGSNNASVSDFRARKKRNAATMRALEKIGRREPLTEEERNSGVFD